MSNWMIAHREICTEAKMGCAKVSECNSHVRSYSPGLHCFNRSFPRSLVMIANKDEGPSGTIAAFDLNLF